GAMGDGKDDAFTAVCFSPDGRNLASGGPQVDKVTLWEAITRERRTTFSGHDSIVRCVAFSPKGRLLASCCQNGTLIVRDIYTKKEILAEKLESPLTSVSF